MRIKHQDQIKRMVVVPLKIIQLSELDDSSDIGIDMLDNEILCYWFFGTIADFQCSFPLF